MLEMNLPILLMLWSAMTGLSSNSWPLIWMMMEINSAMFIFFLMKEKNNSQNSLMYFSFQASSSMFLLLLIITFNITKNLQFNIMLNSSFLNLITMMKTGMFPFHNWMFQMTKNIKWKVLKYLLSSQKILPIKISSMSNHSSLSMTLIILNLLMNPMIMMFLSNTKLIITSSSSFNMCWIMLTLPSSTKISYMYAMTYFTITILLIDQMKKLNLKNLNQTNNKLNPSIINLMINMASLPPTWGFMIKLMALNQMIKSNTPYLIILTSLLSSILLMSNYLKVIYNHLMPKTKSTMSIHKSNMLPTISNSIPPLMLLIN